MPDNNRAATEVTFDTVIDRLSTEKITVAFFIPTNFRRRLISKTPYGYYKIKSPSLGWVTICVRYDDEDVDSRCNEISIKGPNLQKPLYGWNLGTGVESFERAADFVKTLTWSSRLWSHFRPGK